MTPAIMLRRDKAAPVTAAGFVNVDKSGAPMTEETSIQPGVCAGLRFLNHTTGPSGVIRR